MISDRKTVGLCGPSRGSGLDSCSLWEPLERGQQRFANFIRNMGRAAANIGEGDGGFGVGKVPFGCLASVSPLDSYPDY